MQMHTSEYLRGVSVLWKQAVRRTTYRCAARAMRVAVAGNNRVRALTPVYQSRRGFYTARRPYLFSKENKANFLDSCLPAQASFRARMSSTNNHSPQSLPDVQHSVMALFDPLSKWSEYIPLNYTRKTIWTFPNQV